MRYYLIFPTILLLLVSCSPAQQETADVIPTLTSDDSCHQLIERALQTADEVCTKIGRNQACYGSSLVNAEFQSEPAPAFNQTGDVADLNTFRSITTAPLDTMNNIWGVAVIKAQANLPDTLPGQNVTFLIYGDAAVEGITPQMQAVTIRTGAGGENSCQNAPESAVLLQSPEGTQSILNINGASVTLGSTLHITAREGAELNIATIEGTAIVSAFNTTRIASAGAQIRLQLGGENNLQVIGPPSGPAPFDLQVISEAPLSSLEREVPVVSPIAPTTSSTIPAPPSPSADASCVPRPDWTATYTVQRGDTLVTISQRFGLTIEQLQDGNCITNPNILQAGQMLRVPFQLDSSTATPLSTQSPPATPIDPNLRADSTLLQPGECTTIRWEAADAREVFFEGQPVRASSTQQVCPASSATYTLLVVPSQGQQVRYTVRIEIARPG